MTPLDTSSVSPSDAVAALRSYPRRFREVFDSAERRAPDDTGVDELARRAGPAGATALEATAAVSRTWSLLQEALRRIVVQDTPVVEAAVVDPSLRRWDAPAPAMVSDALAALEDHALQLADLVSQVPSDGWTRTASVEGGGSVTALEVVREAVRAGRAGLDKATTILDHAAPGPPAS